MITNPINNNNQSFFFNPLKIVRSLGWIAVAILSLPTVIGPCFAWKKLAAIWSENERPATQKTVEVASETLGQKTTEDLLKKWVEKAPANEDRLTAQGRILHFLKHPADLLDLSNLRLSSLPSIFEDNRFSNLKELHLMGNRFIGSLSIRNLNARITFKELPWRKLDSENFTNTLFNKDLDEEEGFVEMSSKNLPTPLDVKRNLYNQAIAQFKHSGCLGPCSAEAYLDYLKDAYSGFYFDTSLLYSSGLTLDKFLGQIKDKVETAIKETTPEINPLVFVPFSLARNSIREQHIVVAVINKKNEQIEYFDPKGNQFYSILGSWVDRSLANWNDTSSQKFLEELSRSIFPGKEPSIIRNINGPQSLLNKVDCGAHALDFIQARICTHFIQNNNSNYFETSLSSDGRQLRDTMANTLIESLKRTKSL